MVHLPSPGYANKGFTSTNAELAAIDASVRWPVLLCFLSAIHWMVVGTFLLVYASSLTHPQDALPILGYLVDLANNCSFFTYGRVWPAALDALIYGWATIGGIGLAIWVLARTSRVPIRAPGALLTGVIFWNIGVAIGLTGILLGDSTGVEFLEFPAYASWILWLAYALISLSAISTYLVRQPNHDHLAQFWILSGLFAFPWLYAAGSTILGYRLLAPTDATTAISWRGALPGSGVMQEAVNAWYVHGIYTLWLAPIGLGVLYYLIPKMSGLSIEYGSKAKIAFWTWVIIAPWTAVHDLVGGPFPADVVTFALTVSGLIFIPVALIFLNLVRTALDGEKMQGHHGGVVFPFLTLAAMIFVAAGISEQLLSVRSINEVLRFTMFRECNLFLWVYGFYSFTAFGAMYYIVPRLLDFGWRSSFLIKVHYYSSLYGILLVLFILGLGGVLEGWTLENPDTQVTIVMATDVSRCYYIATTMCLSLIALGNGVFALHLGWMLVHWVQAKVRGNKLASEILMEPYEPETVVETPKEASV